MIVQQSAADNSLVNLILKPNEVLNIPLAVKYYIYRGILKSSLINGNNIAAEAPTNNELIARIWKHPPTDIHAGTFGYEVNPFSGHDDVENIFDNLRTGLHSILVKEGEWIGTFASGRKIGFEVVLATDRLRINLHHVRQERHQVDASQLAGFEQRAKREEILYFIDPAAFFGMHFPRGVKYSTYSGTTKTTKSTIERVNNVRVNNTYTLLVNPFSTKNRIYLDVRSEKGYSYNFYQNYGSAINNHNIELGYGINADAEQEYKTDEWPIIFIETAQASGTPAQNKLRLKLRIDDNRKPIIYIENKDLKETERTSNYIKDLALEPEEATGWTNQLKFVFPLTDAGAVASYIKFYYFRRKPDADPPNTVLKNLKYYDSAFCSVDLPKLGEFATGNLHVESTNHNFVREPLVQLDGTGNFEYAAINGAYWDTQRILFYSTLKTKVDDSGSEKFYINTYNRKLNIANKRFRNSLRQNIDILCREYPTADGNLKIPAINSYRTGGNLILRGTLNEKENALLLGLSIPEISAIKNTTGLSDKHHRFIFLQDAGNNPRIDNHGIRYRAYTVRLQGLDVDGRRALVTPIFGLGPIIVYSRDNSFFSSANFSAGETVSPGLNRIEFHIRPDGCVKINDNIDLSLVHDVQDIYYFYTPPPPRVQSEICHLNVIQIDKMENGDNEDENNQVFTSIPPGWLHEIPYPTGVNVRFSYIYPDGTIFSIGREGEGNNDNYILRFKKSSKKSFLVYFDQERINNTNPGTLINFSFSATVRRYFRPQVAAAFIGALIEIGEMGVISLGCCFDNGTCFPSKSHTNGKAVDTAYKNLAAPGMADQKVINAMHKFGFAPIWKGQLAKFAGLTIAVPFKGHNKHLHSNERTLIDCDRNE